MSQGCNDAVLKMIPVDKIKVLNPRDRNARIFGEIHKNIEDVGLKKPITVTEHDGGYLLICGEGRLKVFLNSGEEFIPALIIEATEAEALIMSLAENIARRKYRPIELLEGIQALHTKGYNPKEIAKKTGLSTYYVQGIVQLFSEGEERLLSAVQSGRVSLGAALLISRAGTDGKQVQNALQDAYESGELRGRQLTEARRVIKDRQTYGKGIAFPKMKSSQKISPTTLIQTYQREVARQKFLIKKAEFTQQRFMFIVGAMSRLLSDENFVNLLRAEGIDTLPKYLADHVWKEEAN